MLNPLDSILDAVRALYGLVHGTAPVPTAMYAPRPEPERKPEPKPAARPPDGPPQTRKNG